jgi:serine/threonine-protein kinase
MAEAQDQRIGQLAVERGFLSGSQLREAIAELEKVRQAGSEVPLGEFLIKQGLITRHQLETLLGQQGKPKGKEIIPGYEFFKKLGEGGMGDVYLARQKSMDRLVAIKILPKKLSRDEEFIGRFLREARLAGKLDHVNIVRGLDVSESGGYHYFVMEYVEGKSLDQFIPKSGGMEEDRALHICMQVARALAFAHAKGIVHRDIKPANILVNADDVAKVCDMGLAKQVGSESYLTVTGTTVGTPHYISPEQARGASDIDTRSDIYSLGATLYHCVTGKTPFSGTSAAVIMTKHLTEELPWPQDVNSKVSEHCCHLLEKMMAKDPADRYQTPKELVADMEFVIDGKRPPSGAMEAGKSSVAKAPVVTKKPPKKAAVERRLSRRRSALKDPGEEKKSFPPWALWTSIGAGALVVIVVLSFALSGRKPERPRLEEKPVAEAPKPEPEPEKKADLEVMYEYTVKWANDNPDDLEGAVGKYELLRKRAVGTVWEMKAADAIRDLKKKREKTVAAELEKLRKKAADLVEAGDYDGAVAVYGTLPAALGEALRPGADEAVRELKTAAEERIETALAEAEKLSKDGEPDKGLAEIEKIASVKYAALSDRIADARRAREAETKNVAEMQKRKAQAAARKRLEDLWARFDEKAFSGDHAAARTVVDTGLKDAALRKNEDAVGTLNGLAALAGEMKKAQDAGRKAGEALKGLVGRKLTLRTQKGPETGVVRKVEDGVIHLEVELRAARAVARTVKKISLDDLTPEERRRLIPKKDPTTPDGWLAKSISAMASKDAAGAEAAMLEVHRHPLKTHYRTKLDVLKQAEAEAEAAAKREAEEKIAEPAVSPAPSGAPLTGKGPWRAAWRKMKGQYARGGHVCSAFDTKRGLYLVVVARASVQAYSVSKDEWRELAPPGAGKGVFTKALVAFSTAYEPAKDGVVYFGDDGTCFFDMKTHRWSLVENTAGRESGLTTGPGAVYRYKGWRIFARLDVTGRKWTDLQATGPTNDRGLPGKKCMVWDAARKRFVLFTGKKMNKTCVWDPASNTLTPLKPAASPPPHKWPSLAYDAGNDLVVLHGETGQGSARGRETWVYDAKRNSWLEVPTDPALPPGASYVEYDPANRCCILWDQKTGETWTLRIGTGATAASSSSRTPVPEAPPPVAGVSSTPWRGAWKPLKERHPAGGHCGAAFDLSRNQYVVAGRRFNVWAYDIRKGTWQQIYERTKADAGGIPESTGNPNLVYDPVKRGMVYMGQGGTFFFGSASRRWKVLNPRGALHPALACGRESFLGLWSGASANVFGLNRFDRTSGKWERVKCKLPPGRTYAGDIMAYDPPRKRFIIFGGALELRDTWIYDPSRNLWTEIKPPVSPPARQRPSMCYDPTNEVIVMHGGGRGGTHVTDTWVFECKRNVWAEVNTLKQPPPGTSHIDYCPAMQCCIAWHYRSGELWLLKLVK